MRRRRGRVEVLELRVLKLEETVAELAKWTWMHFNNLQRTSEEDCYDGAVSPVIIVDGGVTSELDESTEAVNKKNMQNNGNQKGDWKEEICCVMYKVQVRDEESDDHAVVNPSNKTWTAAANLESASPIQLRNEVNNTYRMSSTAEGSGCDDEDEIFDDEEAIAQMIIAEEELWQRRRMELCSSEEGDSSIDNETLSTIELKNEDGGDWMSPITAENGRGVVNQGSRNLVGRGKDSLEEDGSLICGAFTGSANSALKSKPKKSPPATKSSSSGSKSAFNPSQQIPPVQNKLVKQNPTWKCPHCPRIFLWKSYLGRHIITHTGERPFLCPHCPYATTQSAHVRMHIRRIHPEQNQNLLPCKICQRTFLLGRNLQEHMKTHMKCYFCSRQLRSLVDVGYHTQTHTGEKPFKCPHCRFSSARACRVGDHISRKHPNAKECGVTRKKIHENEKSDGQFKFNCSFCPYMTNNSSSLVEHVRTHTGLKMKSFMLKKHYETQH